jgi:predicted AAA+ superfamily ATPase
MLNRSDFAAPLGITVPTVTQWLSILEVTGQVFIVPPYFANFGKRLVKAPKIYLTDSGLACHLLGIETSAELERSPFLGALWEGFVASELVKQQVNAGRRRELYYFRDHQGLEVDFLMPAGDGRVRLVEARASRTAFTRMADGLGRRTGATIGTVVYRPSSAVATTALRPGIKALSLRQLLAETSRARR